jgi:hypothetical protein
MRISLFTVIAAAVSALGWPVTIFGAAAIVVTAGMTAWVLTSNARTERLASLIHAIRRAPASQEIELIGHGKRSTTGRSR